MDVELPLDCLVALGISQEKVNNLGRGLTLTQYSVLVNQDPDGTLRVHRVNTSCLKYETLEPRWIVPWYVVAHLTSSGRLYDCKVCRGYDNLDVLVGTEFLQDLGGVEIEAR